MVSWVTEAAAVVLWVIFLRIQKKGLMYKQMVNGSFVSISMEAMTTSCIRDSCIQLQFVQEDLRNLILHCDIKPYNVLFYSDSLPKVADFG